MGVGLTVNADIAAPRRRPGLRLRGGDSEIGKHRLERGVVDSADDGLSRRGGPAEFYFGNMDATAEIIVVDHALLLLAGKRLFESRFCSQENWTLWKFHRDLRFGGRDDLTCDELRISLESFQRVIGKHTVPLAVGHLVVPSRLVGGRGRNDQSRYS